MSDYRAQLRLIRKFTGDGFTPARGYHAGKPPSFGQRMAVLQYYRKVLELTATGSETYTPKRGEKTEAFSYTGQRGFRKFTKAIVRRPAPDSKLKFQIDRKRPRGTRFVVTDKTTGRRYFNVPARLFDYQGDNPNEEANEYQQILDDHADEAEFFLINAGSTYVWGSGGDRETISQKLVELFRNYSAAQFDPHDKASSYYGNWFNGVTGFTSRYDILPEIGKALEARREYRKKWRMSPDRTYRELRNGMLGAFENGRLVETIVQSWKTVKCRYCKQVFNSVAQRNAHSMVAHGKK